MAPSSTTPIGVCAGDNGFRSSTRSASGASSASPPSRFRRWQPSVQGFCRPMLCSAAPQLRIQAAPPRRHPRRRRRNAGMLTALINSGTTHSRPHCHHPTWNCAKSQTSAYVNASRSDLTSYPPETPGRFKTRPTVMYVCHLSWFAAFVPLSASPALKSTTRRMGHAGYFSLSRKAVRGWIWKRRYGLSGLGLVRS